MFASCMRVRSLIVIASFFSVTIAGAFYISGCANIIPPSGGPRDSLPPQLIRVTPPDSSRNVSGNRIVFTFDEYIELQNVQTNMIISPIPQNFPTVDYRLNTMTVRFRDSLEANTTYTLNFGNSIKDYNEGNVLPGFSYIFSTGPAIDSLQLRGNVLLAETGKVDSTLIVMLHISGNDSAVVNERPRYFARLDRNGNFAFRNMPAGTFYIYALQDQGGSQKYLDPKQQLFGFADSPVVIRSGVAPVTLYAYADKAVTTTTPITGLRPRGGAIERRLRFQTTAASGKQDILGKFTFAFETPLKNFDSSKIRLSSDSSFNPVSGYSWEMDTSEKIVQLNYEWKENTLYHFIMEKDFAEDTAGRVLLKEDTLSFRTRAQNEYGSLGIRFRNLDLNANPVLLMFANNELKKSIQLTSETISEPVFLPDEYELRILNDRNKNGKWDPGEFFGKRLQPEIVKPIERRISVKPNQNNEFEITL